MLPSFNTILVKALLYDFLQYLSFVYHKAWTEKKTQTQQICTDNNTMETPPGCEKSVFFSWTKVPVSVLGVRADSVPEMSN